MRVRVCGCGCKREGGYFERFFPRFSFLSSPPHPQNSYYLIAATVVALCIFIIAPLLAVLAVAWEYTATHILIGAVLSVVQLYVIWFNINVMFTSVRLLSMNGGEGSRSITLSLFFPTVFSFSLHLIPHPNPTPQTRATVAQLSCHLLKYKNFLSRQNRIKRLTSPCEPRACGGCSGQPDGTPGPCGCGPHLGRSEGMRRRWNNNGIPYAGPDNAFVAGPRGFNAFPTGANALANLEQRVQNGRICELGQDRWMDVWMWMHGWMGGWMDAWMEGI